MPSSFFLFYASAPECRISIPQCRGRESHQQMGIPGPGNLCPVCLNGQQQSACCAHSAVRQQTRTQYRRYSLHNLQQVRRTPQLYRGHQAPECRRQKGPQTAGCRHQNRAVSHRVPEAVSAVPQRGQALCSVLHTDLYWKQFSLYAVAGRGPKYHGEDQIGRRGGNHQNFGRDVGVKDALCHGEPAACQQSQHQHRPGHSTGDREKQQGHAEEFFLAAKGQQGQQRPHRQFNGRRRQKSTAG